MGARKRKVKCPICRKEVEWEGNPFRPFCSERCKLIDLGRWIGEEYRILRSLTESEVEDLADEESPQS